MPLQARLTQIELKEKRASFTMKINNLLILGALKPEALPLVHRGASGLWVGILRLECHWSAQA